MPVSLAINGSSSTNHNLLGHTTLQRRVQSKRESRRMCLKESRLFLGLWPPIGALKTCIKDMMSGGKWPLTQTMPSTRCTCGVCPLGTIKRAVPQRRAPPKYVSAHASGAVLCLGMWSGPPGLSLSDCRNKGMCRLVCTHPRYVSNVHLHSDSVWKRFPRYPPRDYHRGQKGYMHDQCHDYQGGQKEHMPDQFQPFFFMAHTCVSFPNM